MRVLEQPLTVTRLSFDTPSTLMGNRTLCHRGNTSRLTGGGDHLGAQAARITKEATTTASTSAVVAADSPAIERFTATARLASTNF